MGLTKNSPEEGARQGYVVRKLRPADLERGFLETLGNLSDVGGLSPREARGLFASMKRSPLYQVLVAVESDGEVVGATTLIVEQKFIHRGGLAGHIEDVAVRKGHEGKGIGGSVVRAAVERARELGCYKVILDCKEELVGFYEGLGFRSRDVGMRIDLKPGPPANRDT